MENVVKLVERAIVENQGSPVSPQLDLDGKPQKVAQVALEGDCVDVFLLRFRAALLNAPLGLHQPFRLADVQAALHDLAGQRIRILGAE